MGAVIVVAGVDAVDQGWVVEHIAIDVDVGVWVDIQTLDCAFIGIGVVPVSIVVGVGINGTHIVAHTVIRIGIAIGTIGVAVVLLYAPIDGIVLEFGPTDSTLAFALPPHATIAIPITIPITIPIAIRDMLPASLHLLLLLLPPSLLPLSLLLLSLSLLLPLLRLLPASRPVHTIAIAIHAHPHHIVALVIQRTVAAQGLIHIVAPIRHVRVLVAVLPHHAATIIKHHPYCILQHVPDAVQVPDVAVPLDVRWLSTHQRLLGWQSLLLLLKQNPQYHCVHLPACQ